MLWIFLSKKRKNKRKEKAPRIKVCLPLHPENKTKHNNKKINSSQVQLNIRVWPWRRWQPVSDIYTSSNPTCFIITLGLQWILTWWENTLGNYFAYFKKIHKFHFNYVEERSWLSSVKMAFLLLVHRCNKKNPPYLFNIWYYQHIKVL